MPDAVVGDVSPLAILGMHVSEPIQLYYIISNQTNDISQWFFHLLHAFHFIANVKRQWPHWGGPLRHVFVRVLEPRLYQVFQVGELYVWSFNVRNAAYYTSFTRTNSKYIWP